VSELAWASVALAITAATFFAVAMYLGRFAIELRKTLDVQLKILSETRAMLAGFFPKHIEDSLDKVPNDGKESFVHAPSTWDDEKMGRD
jgi:hypothetical protein